MKLMKSGKSATTKKKSYRNLLIAYFFLFLALSSFFVENREKPVLNWIEPDLHVYQDLSNKISEGKIPILDFRLDAYPIALSVIVMLLSPVSRSFELFSLGFGLITAAFATATVFLLLKISDSLQVEKKRIIFFALSPTLLIFNWARFDIIPVFFLLLSLYAFLRSRNRLAGIFSAVGALFKMFPLSLAAADFLSSRKFFLTAILLFLLINAPFFLLNYDNAVYSFFFSVSRDANPDSLFGLLQSRFSLNPTSLALISFAILIFSLLFVKLKARIVELTFALIVIVIATSIRFSPQWIVWMVPLLDPLWGEA